MTNQTQTQKGFTLIEMIVAIGIFVVLLQIVAFTYSRFVGVERQNIGQQEMQEDMRLFLQLFNREARTGFGNTYQTISHGVVFRNQEGVCVKYEHDTAAHALLRSDSTNKSESNLDASHDCADPIVYNAARLLTDSENTVIEELSFEAVAAQPPFLPPPAPPVTQLTQQGFITVHMRIRAAADQTEGTRLQSTVASRQTLPYTY